MRQSEKVASAEEKKFNLIYLLPDNRKFKQIVYLEKHDTPLFTICCDSILCYPKAGLKCSK